MHSPAITMPRIRVWTTLPNITVALAANHVWNRIELLEQVKLTFNETDPEPALASNISLIL